jgi:hypothetical protein
MVFESIGEAGTLMQIKLCVSACDFGVGAGLDAVFHNERSNRGIIILSKMRRRAGTLKGRSNQLFQIVTQLMRARFERTNNIGSRGWQ